MIPTRSQLIYFYDLFQWNPLNVTASDIVDFTQISRFDPISSEIIMTYLFQNFEKINPLEIRDLNLKSKTPQALCVLLDIIQILYGDQLSPNWEGFKSCIQASIPKAPFQSYYIGLYGINPKQSLKQIKQNLKVYENWGFYCHELPLSKVTKNLKKTLISKSKRLEHLKHLLKSQKRLTVKEYLKSLNFAIHPRQAERDLKNFPNIKFMGNTKGRIYYL